MSVCRSSGIDSLFGHAPQIVGKHEAYGSDTHRAPVSKRSPWKDGVGQVIPIVASGYGFEDLADSSPIAAFGIIVGGKSLCERGRADFSVRNERLGHSDHHLRVVGVAKWSVRRPSKEV
jgi:hypothetical protein